MLWEQYKASVAILTQVVVQGGLVMYLPTKYITGLDLDKALKFCLNPLTVLTYGLMTVPLWWSGQILCQTCQICGEEYDNLVDGFCYECTELDKIDAIHYGG